MMVEELPHATLHDDMAALRFSVARPSAALTERLMRGEVHVWRARADEAGSYLKRDCLSLSEHERAARLKYGAHRELFVFSRAMLRVVLGEYLSVDPARLVFDVEPGGKPVLFGRDLEFSVSHGSGAVLMAIAKQRVGCDLESLDRKIDVDALAAASLGERERDLFAQTPACARQRLLLQLWTRKEALLKAHGTGLRRDPRELEMPWPALPAARDECASDGVRWAVADVALGAAWRAAVAMENRGADVHGFCLGW
ncbi:MULTISPECIES: 4'-phosphopantetheinyl transferase family protein [Burkholderia]|uniref:4'-phosphopantetheinyl transferase n=1 Tax=Burkholderia mayonis TaxID=1385591 RepID=A0A1B4FPQ9_9BURK|nr:MULTISPECIES: 4'-phosphopantetheinyl transferase superfamily protein [Burkholderia]AOJ05619.1 4'-phosphopantetheinyl transferase [Burkholderia mayonis]KVE38084.1 4'-phosphopantetheinyl transferase [Burkholderia sp. BDU5]KVE44452.1 4'-phosphopantetheinyl transferase [Burkholderia mayonis]